MKHNSLLSLLSVLGCFLATAFLSSPTLANEKVIYAGAPNISTPAIIAAENGYFAAEGMDVEYQPIQTGKLAMEAVMAGRADFASVVIPNVVYGGFQTIDLRIIASYGVTLDDAVVFPSTSLIHKAVDLKGKRIGLALSTSSQDFLIHLLDKNGLSWSDITPISLQPPTMLAALKGGQVDAVVTWQPWRAGIRKALNGEVREIVNENNIYRRHTFCATNAAYLAKHPDAPAKLLRALIKAEDFINAYPEQTAQLVAKKTGQELEAVRTYISPVRVHISNEILTLIKSYATWVTRHQEDFLNKSLPAYNQNIASEYLKQVDAKRVENGL